MKRRILLAGFAEMLIGFIFLLLPLSANAATLPPITWTPVSKLTPLASGSGVVVAEPVASDKKLADFGAGCARWLHLNVSSNVAFEKTPTWDGLGQMVQTSAQKNLQLAPEDAKVLFQRLGVTRVVTGNIQKKFGAISLKWQVWSLPDLKLIGEVSADATSQEAVVTALPQTGQKLVAMLGGDEKYYQDNVITPTLTADELAFIGSVPWEPGNDAPPETRMQLGTLSKKSLLANLFFVTYLKNVNAPNFSDHFRELTKTAMTRLISTVIKAPDNGNLKKNLLAVQYCYRLAHYQLRSQSQIPQPGTNLFTTYPNNYLSQLQTFMALGVTAANLEHLEMAVRLNSKNANAWSMLADAYAELMQATRKSRVAADLSDAESEYLHKVTDQEVAAVLKSVQLDHSNGRYWSKLSSAATFDGNEEMARQAMDKALELAPENSSPYKWAFQMYQPKWFDDSDKFFSTLNQLFQHPDVLAECTDSLIVVFRQFDSKDQIAFVKQIITTLQPYAETHPQNLVVQNVLADLSRQTSQLKIAQIAYERFAKILPDDPLGYRSWRRIAEMNKDWPTALVASTSLIKLDESANWYERISNNSRVTDMQRSLVIHLENAKYKDAEKDALWLREHNLIRPYEAVYLANIHLILNDPVAAEADLQWVRDNDRDHKGTNSEIHAERPDFYSISALVLWRTNKNKEAAQKLFDKALNITPQTYKSYAANVIGKVYADYAVFLAEQGQKVKAQEAAAKAKEIGYGINYGMLEKAGL